MRVRLRKTTADDLDFVLAVEGDEENLPFIGQWTREQHLAALQDPDTSHLIVARTEDGRRVGHLILTGLTDREQGIRLRRICVTEKGEGYGREALRLAIRLAFEELQTPRLWLIVRGHNLRARRLYQSEGFVREAPPEGAADAAAPADSPITMSLLKPEGDV